MRSNNNNPEGNPNFSGGPGSGRKSIKGKRGRKTAKEEGERYDNEFALMYEPSDIEAIKEKIRQKKPVSVREIMLLKEAGGNDRLIAVHYGKVVPDQIILPGGKGEIKISWKK